MPHDDAAAATIDVDLEVPGLGQLIEAVLYSPATQSETLGQATLRRPSILCVSVDVF